jgi:hypothetical protein
MELARYVRSCFDDAMDFKQREILPRLLTCQRLKKGEYEPDKMAAINAQGGSKMFFNITETKSEAFAAWVTEIMVPDGESSWSIAPTPIPDLPDEVKQQVANSAIEELRARAMAGESVSPQDMYKLIDGMFDEQLQLRFDEAKKRCERMEKKISDQMVEGGFYQAMAEFIQYMSEYPIAIFKGPVVRMVKELKWNNDADGNPTPAVSVNPMPTWTTVNPYNFYPAPNMKNVDDGYICELVEYNLKELSEFKGAEGYNADAIDAVLLNPPPPMWINGDSERAQLEGRDVSINSGLSTSVVRGIEYWGSISGKMLQEWGMAVENPAEYYDACVVLIGNQVIRAVLNPDPLGRRPYYVDSFISRPDSIYGRSIPEKMQDCQDGTNAAHRTMLNNMAMAGGPQVSVDLDSLSPGQDATSIVPWKIWAYSGKRAAYRQSAKPIDFFQPDSNSAECIAIAKYFTEQSDERTMIPRYSYGENDLGGAGQTASGLSMMMSSAARSIKRVVRSISRKVQCPAISRQYTWDMLYLPDGDFAKMKGDVKVQPKGVLALMVKEQMLLRRQEFLVATNNPTDLQIMGVQGRSAVLREVASELGMAVEKIIPNEEAIRASVMRSMQSQMANGAASNVEDETNGGAA